jgi:hypothetical protein
LKAITSVDFEFEINPALNFATKLIFVMAEYIGDMIRF